jgi:hypothetical protein
MRQMKMKPFHSRKALMVPPMSLIGIACQDMDLQERGIVTLVIQPDNRLSGRVPSFINSCFDVSSSAEDHRPAAVKEDYQNLLLC